MHLVVVGLNHKTAQVEVREKLAVSEADLPKAIETLQACQCVAECCILSTCNRTEIYALIDSRENEEVLLDFISSYHGIPKMSFQDHIYRHRGHKAVEHLFSVTAGLDSMMIGEYQILGQVKDAFCIAGECDSTKTVLNNLFQQALSVGKRARSETDISKGAFSIGYAAVELARSIFGSLQELSILILGAGKMGELTAKHLISAGAKSISVANRTPARAEELAVKLGGCAVPFESFTDAMTQADVVIGSTGAPEPIVTKDQMAKIMRIRREKPIFMIDIAVPRDIEADAGDLDNVFLYDIDDLQALVQESVAERHKEIEKVREIIAEETRKFNSWFRTLEVVPLIKTLRQQFDDLREAEWQRNAGKLGHLSEKDQQTVQIMMQSLINRISHNPMIKIKEYASSPDGYSKLDTARELFGIIAEEVEDAEKPEQNDPEAAI
ncbi:MAG TPA: glutamyl-tRNA reductase [Armatimonadota bacterium]|nr:glutamyl-tRNA reductase [Armatimonadota bacterium]